MENINKENEPIKAIIVEDTEKLSSVMSITDWIITFVLLSIPLVNLIMLIIWAAGDAVNKNKKNFAIATLIILGVSVLFSILFWTSMMGAISSSLTIPN